jgi:hypothetical protein
LRAAKWSRASNLHPIYYRGASAVPNALLIYDRDLFARCEVEPREQPAILKLFRYYDILDRNNNF